MPDQLTTQSPDQPSSQPSDQPSTHAPAGAPTVRSWAALGALAAAVLVIGLDLTVLNVALPTLGAALDATASDLQWIVDAYALAFAAAMLPAGWLGDRLGRRPVLLVGLVAFGATSFAAAAAHGVGALIAARIGMGLAAALVLPVAMAIVPSLFDEAHRQRAVTVMVGCVGLGLPLGPIVGGVLLDHFWWGSVFLVTVPVVAASLLAAIAFLPRAEARRTEPLDVVALAAAMGATTALVYAAIEAPEVGWVAPRTLGLLAASLGCAALVAIRQRRAAFPLVPRVILARPVFWRGTLVVCVPTAAMSALLFLLPMHLQLVRGAGTSAVGLQLMPFMLALIVAGLAAERLAGRFGLRVWAGAGLVLTAKGLAILALLDPAAGYHWLALGLAVTGFGVGLTLVPVMNAVLGALAPAVEGVGSAVNNTARQTAGALGVALLGSVQTAVYRSSLESGSGLDATGRAALAALPAPVREAVSGSFPGAHLVAASLPDGVRTAVVRVADAAFVDGMRVAFLATAAVLLLVAGTVRWVLPVTSQAPVTPSGRDVTDPDGSDREPAVEPAADGVARAQEGAHPGGPPGACVAAVRRAGV
jgi:EmrB/QacA subfamily drug resistance transporter